MRKSGKFLIVLVLLMALALTATLVACDDSTGQNSTINGGGGGGGGPEVTTRYYGLDFDRPGSIVYTDFDIQSVTGWVLVQTGDARPVRSNVSFTVTEDSMTALRWFRERYDRRGDPCDRYIRTSLVRSWKKDKETGKIVVETLNSVYHLDPVKIS